MERNHSEVKIILMCVQIYNRIQEECQIEYIRDDDNDDKSY